MIHALAPQNDILNTYLILYDNYTESTQCWFLCARTHNMDVHYCNSHCVVVAVVMVVTIALRIACFYNIYM